MSVNNTGHRHGRWGSSLRRRGDQPQRTLRDLGGRLEQRRHRASAIPGTVGKSSCAICRRAPPSNFRVPATSVITGASFSPDSSSLLFSSTAANLVPGIANPGGAEQLYLRNLATGTTQMVSVNPAGNGAGNDGSIGGGQFSGNGQFVLFESRRDKSDSGRWRWQCQWRRPWRALRAKLDDRNHAVGRHRTQANLRRSAATETRFSTTPDLTAFRTCSSATCKRGPSPP